MRHVRLIPIVLFAASALLALKVVGLTTGTGSFAVGPSQAIAAGDRDPLLEPIDLAQEAESLRMAQEEAAKAAGVPSAEDPTLPQSPDLEPEPEPAKPEVSANLPPVAPEPAEPAPTAPDPPALLSPAGLPVSTVRPEEFTPPVVSSETAILESLAERRRQLEAREEEINLRLKLLEAAEVKLQQRLDELKNIEAQLGGAAAEARKSGEENLKGLVSMYENMKPKAAAEVFNSLDLQVLMALVEVMNPRKMAAVLGAMDPAKAGQLTVALAGNVGPAAVVIRREVSGEAGLPAEVPAAPMELPKIQPAGAN